MTQPMQPAAASDHARHDETLIAALVDREPDLPARDLATARERIAACEGCRDLFADLVLLRDALPASATPMRTRDFTLTDADVRRLAPSGWRRVVGFFGSARDGFSRPLAIGFTTIGIAALVVTATPISLGSFATGGAASPALSTVGGAAQGEPSREVTRVEASAAPSAAAAAPSAGSAAASEAPMPSLAASAGPASYGPAASGEGRTTAGKPYATDGDSGKVFTGSNDTDAQPGDADTELLQGSTGTASPHADSRALAAIIGGICLIVGLGLFALRWTSRRLGAA